jgi:hypothetical protein
VIARYEIHSRKIIIHVLQCFKTVVERKNVQGCPIVVPVAQEETGITSFFLGFGSGPLHKFQTVFVVYNTIRFQAKVDVSPHGCFFEKISHSTTV